MLVAAYPVFQAVESLNTDSLESLSALRVRQ